MTITKASLCTGYGGLDAAAVSGLGIDVDTLWHAEVDADACAVLDKRRPAPNLGDIVTADWSRWPRPYLLTMGPPCQPVSAAGRQLAEVDARWLWPACAAAIAALRPHLIVFENVRNLTAIRKGEVWRSILTDLRELGYAVRWTIVGACAVGSCHHRHRVFLVAALMRGPAPTAVRVDAIECGAPRTGSRILLPTPTTSEMNGAGHAADGGINLRTAVSLLPTPTAVRHGNNRGGAAGRVGPTRHSLDSVAALLPSPTARDGDPRGRGEGTPAYWAERIGRTGRTEGVPLGAAVQLLPTPNASDSQGGPRAVPAIRTTDGPDHGPRLRDVVVAQWGVYAEAVELWQALSGRPVPDPTEPSTRGTGVRLAPELPEWMMDLDAGYLTDVVGRSAALRLAGNGVHELQGAAAIRILLP